MKTSATRAFRVEIVAMCTVGIISTRAKRTFNARYLNIGNGRWRAHFYGVAGRGSTLLAEHTMAALVTTFAR
jgi:hypothetical protein